MKSIKSNTKGFTLIELLVVIAIIGILSSITVVSLNSARAKGRDAKRIADVKQMQLALAMYYDACGRQYPNVTGAMPTATLSAATANGCTGATVGSFLNPIPTPPTIPANGHYYYGVNNSGGTNIGFVISTTLENGSNMPTDDIDGNSYGGVACADPIYCITD